MVEPHPLVMVNDGSSTSPRGVIWGVICEPVEVSRSGVSWLLQIFPSDLGSIDQVINMSHSAPQGSLGYYKGTDQ